MEGVNHATFMARVLLTLMQQVAVNKHQCACLDLTELIHLFLTLFVLFETSRPLRAFVISERGAAVVVLPHEAVADRCALV